MPDEEGRDKEPSPTDTGFLDAVPDGQRILTRARAGSKAGAVKGYLENAMIPPEAREWVRQGGNVGVKLGGIDSDDWTPFVLDVEESGDLPDQATDVVERCTLGVFESPHGGRNRLISVTDDAYRRLDNVKTKIDLDNDGDHEVEFLTSGHAIAPPSKVNHSDCSDGKAGCPGDGTGKYELVKWKPDAEVMTEADAEELVAALDITPDESTTGSSQPEHARKLPEVNLSDGKGDEVLRTLQKTNVASFNALMTLLQGGVGPWKERLYTDGGSTDRSQQELMALSRVYLSARELADLDNDEARQVAQNILDRYTAEYPDTIDGQPRKWTNSPYDDYQEDQREAAFRTADPVTFQRFLNFTSGDHETDHEKWDGDYGDVTYNITRFTIDLFTRPHEVKSLSETFDEDPTEGLRTYASITFELDLEPEVAEYLHNEFLSTPHHSVQDVDPPTGGAVRSSSVNVRPTKQAVVDVALVIDNGLDEDPREDDRSEGTYKQAVGDLKRWGELKMAVCYGRPDRERYVYYFPEQPDPPDADQIEIGGEETAPKEENVVGSPSPFVTDG